jgi:phytoene synthase
MGVQVITHGWEYQLLDWANEALSSHAPDSEVTTDRLLLEVANAHCEAMTAQYSKTFHMASALLPPDKRRAARALYAFCRVTDNIVDMADSDNPREALERWRGTIMLPQPPTGELVALAWADTQQRFRIPAGYAVQLIEGVRRDFTQNRYATFDELTEYAYGVASTVGLMAMHIIGFTGSAALPYAIKLGVALQVTNILRDVGEDWRNGRLYLPQEELRQFGLSEADIDAGTINERWRQFMAFQIDRVRRLYAESLPGMKYLSGDGRFAIAAAAALYAAILDEIERNDYDVFTRRASVSTVGKLRRLPGTWWRAHRATR